MTETSKTKETENEPAHHGDDRAAIDSVRSYIRRWRRKRFWDDHHTPLKDTGEEMIEALRGGMER